MGQQKLRDLSIVPEGVKDGEVQAKVKGRQAIKKDVKEASGKKKEDIKGKIKTEKEIEKDKKEKPEKETKVEKKVEAKKSKKTAPQPQIRKKPLHGKKYRKVLEELEKDKTYPIDKAIKLAKETSYSKFGGSIELHIRLGIDPKKKEQAVRTNFVLPHSTGKKVKIVVFTSKPASLKGKVEAVGGEELVKKIAKGWSDFDVALATPEMMPKIAKVAKILGPKGKMPNPKSGTITDKPEEVIEEFSKGKIEVKSDAGGSVHIALGKLDMEDKKIKENLLKAVEALNTARPSGIKGNFLRSITLSASMGPGIKVDPESLT